jgi:RNA polymerase sigma factor (sigma-70 family)
MTSSPELIKNNFEKLLSWLNADRFLAAEKYEAIRLRLIKIFVVRGSTQAEDLADEVIERVTNKVFDVADTYEGDPSLYFYGVAQNVFLESLRKPKHEELPAVLASKEKTNLDESKEAKSDCLESCLNQLESNQRQLILSYYESEKKTKIDNRKLLAEKLGITLEILRIRAFRIRNTLQKCVLKCVAKN